MGDVVDEQLTNARNRQNSIVDELKKGREGIDASDVCLSAGKSLGRFRQDRRWNPTLMRMTNRSSTAT